MRFTGKQDSGFTRKLTDTHARGQVSSRSARGAPGSCLARLAHLHAAPTTSAAAGGGEPWGPETERCPARAGDRHRELARNRRGPLSAPRSSGRMTRGLRFCSLRPLILWAFDTLAGRGPEDLSAASGTKHRSKSTRWPQSTIRLRLYFHTASFSFKFQQELPPAPCSPLGNSLRRPRASGPVRAAAEPHGSRWSGLHAPRGAH